MIFSPTALAVGGHPSITLLVTLSHFSSSFDNFESHSFSRSNTLFSHLDLRISFFTSSIDILAVLPLIEVQTYLISLYPLKYIDISHTSLLITSVRIHTGPSITNVVALLSSHGNSSNPTFGAMKNIENIKNTSGKTIASLRIQVCSRKFLSVFLYQLMVLCMALVRRDAECSSIFVFHIRSSSSNSLSSGVAYSRVVSLSTYVFDLLTKRR